MSLEASVERDLDLILSSQLDLNDHEGHLSTVGEYTRHNSASLNFKSLFIGDDQDEKDDEVDSLEFLDTPPSSSTGSLGESNDSTPATEESPGIILRASLCSLFQSSESEIDIETTQHQQSESSAHPSYLQMLLQEDEERIGVELSKAGNKVPLSFPTRPKNCTHHIIPFSLFTDEALKRFPENLHTKRHLIAKHGEPKFFQNPHVIYAYGSQQSHPLSVINVNVEEIPTIVATEARSRSKSNAGGKGNSKKHQILLCRYCCKTYKQLAALRRHCREKHGVTTIII